MYYLDKKIENLHRIFDQNERSSFLRLDLNENPGGLPEDFIKDVMAKVTPRLVSQYPETLPFTEKLAEFLGTDISHLCLVNGSAEGIRYIIQAFTAPGGRIVGVVPSYFMFQVYSEMYGRNFIKVPYDEDLSMNVDNIIKEITDDTQLLILLNPNNPMGNVYSDEEFERIMERAIEKQVTRICHPHILQIVLNGRLPSWICRRMARRCENGSETMHTTQHQCFCHAACRKCNLQP